MNLFHTLAKNYSPLTKKNRLLPDFSELDTSKSNSEWQSHQCETLLQNDGWHTSPLSPASSMEGVPVGLMRRSIWNQCLKPSSKCCWSSAWRWKLKISHSRSSRSLCHCIEVIQHNNGVADEASSSTTTRNSKKTGCSWLLLCKQVQTTVRTCYQIQRSNLIIHQEKRKHTGSEPRG